MKCFMVFLTLALLLMCLPLKPDYFLKIIHLDCPTLLSLRKKQLLAQAPPLDSSVHPHQPGDYVLIKTWKENKLEPAWEGHFLVLLTTETAFWTLERGWNHHTNQSTLSVSRASGRGPLLETLPSNWAGTCALVQLAIPFTLAFRSTAHATIPRKRRDIGIDVAASCRDSLGPSFLY
jgi:hypothetical protein